MATRLISKRPERQDLLSHSLHKKLGATLPFQVWLTLIRRMLILVGEEILSSTAGFVLPYQLGLLIVESYKKRGDKFFDFIHFCKTGEKRVNLNLHSFGKIYRINWIRTSKVRFSTNSLYEFKAVRTLNRNLAREIFSGRQYKAYEPNLTYDR